jgi:hypothetical protein
MKKLSLFLLACLFSVANGQTYTRKFTEMDMKGVPGNAFNCTFTLTNTSSDPIKIFINRYYKVIPPYWSSCYCYLACELPTTDTLSVYIDPWSQRVVTVFFKTDSVNPGFATSSFKMHQIGYESATFDFTITADTRTPSATGIAKELSVAGPVVFPNPTDGKCRVSASVPIERMSLVGPAGNREFLPAGTELDLSPYPPGLYILEITTSDQSTWRKKLLIQ